jgi:hypothetical protein
MHTWINVHTLAIVNFEDLMKATVAERRQVTIPEVLRDKLGFQDNSHRIHAAAK